MKTTTLSRSVGFASPAEEFAEQPLNFDELLVQNPIATYVIRMTGESMRRAGIFSGDHLVVDRSVTPKSGHVVVAVVEGKFMVKRLLRVKGIWCLVSESANFFSPPLRLTAENTLFWGVVTYVLHKP